MSVFNTPILLLIFNRPESTRLVFDTIQQLKPKRLFVAADGPRNNVEGDRLECEEARKIITDGINWDCDLKLLFRENNVGCRKAVSTALDWFFNDVEEGIILEDDTLPDASFFPYCKQLLDVYRNDERVWSISGYNFGADNLLKKEPYVFARYMNMWGWATWRRNYLKVDYGLRKWKQAENKKLYTSLMIQDTITDLDITWFNFWNTKFSSVANSELDTWDYQWIFAQLLSGQLTIYPSVNMVENIGFNYKGTHTTDSESRMSKVVKGRFDLFPILEYPARINYAFQEKYLKEIWCNISYKRPEYIKVLKFKLRQLKYYLKHGSSKM